MACDLEILHQDDDLVAVNKPAGVAVHRSSMVRDREVVLTMLRDKLGRYVHPVHRLDRGTSGVLLFALHSEAAASAQSSMEHSATKEYVALVRGEFESNVDVDYPIPSDEGGSTRVSAQTSFFPLESFGWASLVSAKPRTGRFHQVRRHLAHLRFPIANDTNYGTGWFNRKVRAELGIQHLALHAQRLTIDYRGRTLSFFAPLREELSSAIALLRGAMPDPEVTY